jgi:hypothetical protein
LDEDYQLEALEERWCPATTWYYYGNLAGNPANGWTGQFESVSGGGGTAGTPGVNDIVDFGSDAATYLDLPQNTSDQVSGFQVESTYGFKMVIDGYLKVGSGTNYWKSSHPLVSDTAGGTLPGGENQALEISAGTMSWEGSGGCGYDAGSDKQLNIFISGGATWTFKPSAAVNFGAFMNVGMSAPAYGSDTGTLNFTGATASLQMKDNTSGGVTYTPEIYVNAQGEVDFNNTHGIISADSSDDILVDVGTVKVTASVTVAAGIEVIDGSLTVSTGNTLSITNHHQYSGANQTDSLFVKTTGSVTLTGTAEIDAEDDVECIGSSSFIAKDTTANATATLHFTNDGGQLQMRGSSTVGAYGTANQKSETLSVTGTGSTVYVTDSATVAVGESTVSGNTGWGYLSCVNLDFESTSTVIYLYGNGGPTDHASREMIAVSGTLTNSNDPTITLGVWQSWTTYGWSGNFFDVTY